MLRALLTGAWIGAARARRRAASRSDPRGERERTVRELAPGRSFVDVGGMWSVHGRIAFVAEEAGASSVALLDPMSPTPEFRREHARRSSSVSLVAGDLHDPVTVEEVGVHDVVWCTGVLYHSPNPFALLHQLRRLTGELLYLGTYLIPEVPGVEQACVFFPGRGPASEGAFRRAYGGGHPGMDEPVDRTPLMGYANTWWGISRSALRSMLDIARFELVEERQWSPFDMDVVVRPLDAEPVDPPVDAYRLQRDG